MQTREISLDRLTLEQGKLIEDTQQGKTYLCSPQGLMLCGSGPAGAPMGGISWENMHYLTVEAECLEDQSAALELHLWEQGTEGEYDMRILFGILPCLMTPVPIALQNLDSQVIFPERNNGRLKMGVFGKPVDWQRLDRVTLVTLPSHHEHKVRIRRMYLSDEKPEVTFAPQRMMDEIGQWMKKAWPGKVANRNECTRILQNLLAEAEHFDGHYENPEWDAYGGWKAKPLDKTGWFHTQHDGKRWWLVDPEGNAFFSTGIDSVIPGSDTRVDVMEPFFSWLPPKTGDFSDCWEKRADTPKQTELANFGIANLITAFGPTRWWECWAKITKMYLIRHGFNTIGSWSQKAFIDYAGMPYVLPLDRYSPVGFPGTAKMVFRDFPDVFSPEFEKNTNEYAAALKPFVEDRNMIGYFLRNEPAWAFIYNLNIAEESLANPNELDSKRELIRWLREKYGTISVLNKKWNLQLDDFAGLLQPIRKACTLSMEAEADLTEFSQRMISRYVELPSQKCKMVDKNHLNLGMRYAYITDKSLLAGYQNFDVFSINSYSMNPLKDINVVGQMLNMPVMIGEFHHGAFDRGLTATGIRAVENQKERGTAYRYYIEQGACSPYFLGAHYFMLNDQSCLGRFDGENYQIGMLDVCMQKYEDISQSAARCHEEVYRVADGQQAAFSKPPVEIPTTHY
jgi:Beta-galactosidase